MEKKKTVSFSFCLTQSERVKLSFFLTCSFLKHATNAVHSSVLRQPLGGHHTLCPALLCLPQCFIHTCSPFVCCLHPVRGGLILHCRIIQDLRLGASKDTTIRFKMQILLDWLVLRENKSRNTDFIPLYFNTCNYTGHLSPFQTSLTML